MPFIKHLKRLKNHHWKKLPLRKLYNVIASLFLRHGSFYPPQTVFRLYSEWLWHNKEGSHVKNQFVLSAKKEIQFSPVKKGNSAQTAVSSVKLSVCGQIFLLMSRKHRENTCFHFKQTIYLPSLMFLLRHKLQEKKVKGDACGGEILLLAQPRLNHIESTTPSAREELTVSPADSRRAALFAAVCCRRSLIWACSEWTPCDLEVHINFAWGLLIK